MLREQGEGLLTMMVAELEFASFIVQIGNIVGWLEQKCIWGATLAKVNFCLVNEAFAQFEHSQIVECLRMLRIVTHSYFEWLIGQT